MTEPEENRRQQNRFRRAKNATEMREKDAAKLKFLPGRVERGDGDAPGERAHDAFTETEIRVNASCARSPGASHDAFTETEIRVHRQVKIRREHHRENQDEVRAEPRPRNRFAQAE